MGHNRENFGALLKSIIGNLKSIIGSGLAQALNDLNARAVDRNQHSPPGSVFLVQTDQLNCWRNVALY